MAREWEGIVDGLPAYSIPGSDPEELEAAAAAAKAAMRGIEHSRYHTQGSCGGHSDHPALALDSLNSKINVSAPHMHYRGLMHLALHFPKSATQPGHNENGWSWLWRVCWWGAPSIRILDVGCGTGFMTKALYDLATRLGYRAHVKGIDCVRALIDKAKALHAPHASMTFDVCDVNHLPVRTPGYHFIHAGFMLNPAQWARLRGCLAEDGWLVGPLDGAWTQTSKHAPNVEIGPVQYIGDTSPGRPVGCTLTGGSRHAREQALIAKERHNRFSHACTDMNKICNIAAVTARSARMYVAHLFPDYTHLAAVRARVAGARVVDVACGLNPFLRHAFLARVAGAAGQCVGVDVQDFGTRRPAPGVRYVRCNLLRRRAPRCLDALLPAAPAAAAVVVLMHNFFYLWEESPARVRRGLRALRRLLRTPDSEIRIFPCYFGRRDLFSPSLRRFIRARFRVRVLRPRLMAERVPVLRGERVTWVPWHENMEEVRANQRLRARTLVLTPRVK